MTKEQMLKHWRRLRDVYKENAAMNPNAIQKAVLRGKVEVLERCIKQLEGSDL